MNDHRVTNEYFLGKINSYPSLGRCGSYSAEYYNGKMDEISVWNKALTQSEIRQNMCQKLKGNELGLVGYWRMDEGSGNIAYDCSGNGNNRTLY